MTVRVHSPMAAYKLEPLITRTPSQRVRRTRIAYASLTLLMPMVGALVAIARAAQRGVGAVELVSLSVMYFVTGLGITVGYHRGLSHRAFVAHPILDGVLLALGAMAGQGPALRWVADHRRHHEFSDQPGDPHSPRDGVWHAHVGWLFTSSMSNPLYYCRDAMRNPRARFVSQTYPHWIAAGIVLPGLVAYAMTRDVEALVSAMLWGGFIRLVLSSHASFAVNSIAHLLGNRSFATHDHSGNVAWLAIPTLGEAWHNNHHANPTAAHFGLRKWQFDLGGYFITVMAGIGLITQVRSTDSVPKHSQ